MPCFDGREGLAENIMMRFCCETLTQLVENGGEELIPEYIKDWWRDHQAWDVKQGRPHKKGQHKK